MSTDRPKHDATIGPSVAATVVIVNGDASEGRRLAEIAKGAGHQVFALTTAQEFLHLFVPPPRTVLVLDSLMIDERCTDNLIEELEKRGVRVPTLVTVPSYGIVAAVDAVRRNAVDILEQPITAKRLLHSIEAALRAARGPTPRPP